MEERGARRVEQETIGENGAKKGKSRGKTQEKNKNLHRR